MKEFYIDEFGKVLPIITGSQNSMGLFGPQNNARWQEAVLSLALWDKEKFKEKILRGIEAWSKLQNKNGSLVENGKESYAATAFSLYAISKSLNELDEIDFLTNLENACSYLSSHTKIETANQEVSAGLALIETSNILGNYKKEGIKKIKNVIKNQSKEGWYPEYYGPDVGYGSLTLELLGLVYLKNILKKKIIDSGKKFVEWIKYFIFPDGSIGGSYNTRTCGWLILDGFEIFKKNISFTDRIIKKHIDGHRKGIFSATHLIDKKHVMTDAWRLLSAYRNYSSIMSKMRLPCENKEFDIFFRESETYVFKKFNFMGIISANENARSGLTLWKPRKLLVDLNKKYPILCKSRIVIKENKVDILGHPLFFRKITRRFSSKKLGTGLVGVSEKLTSKSRINYLIENKKIKINSNKPLIISGFGINGEKKKIQFKDNIFFKSRYLKIKRGNFFEE